MLEDKSDSMATPSNRAAPRLSEDDLGHWAWTEPSVWTNPMLATLENNSVRGGKRLLRGPTAVQLDDCL